METKSRPNLPDRIRTLLLLLALPAVSLGILTGCGKSESAETPAATATAEEETAETAAPADEMADPDAGEDGAGAVDEAGVSEESDASDEPDYENLVTDAYSYIDSYSDGYSSIDIAYALPQINLSGADIQEVNAEIYDALYYGIVEDELANMSAGVSIIVYEITYDWAVNGDILSLYITCNDDFAWTDYYIYNLSISKEAAVSDEELIADYGLSWDEYQTLLYKVLYEKEQNWKLYVLEAQSAVDSNEDNLSNLQTWVDEAIDKTLSSGNIALAAPFLNEDGDLCVSIPIYSIAGAEYYYNLLNLETGDSL